jgi:hypothetical protein
MKLNIKVKQKLIKVRINMKHILITIVFLMTAPNLVAQQVSDTVDLTTAGTLKQHTFSYPAETITNLTLTGTIDARDVQFMRDSMTVLAVLDLGGVTIAAYSGAEGTAGTNSNSYSANEMPSNSFCAWENNSSFKSKTTLVSIVFPSGLTSIGYESFRGCSGLTALSLPAGVTAIGEEAFQNCYNLTGTLALPDGLKSVGNYAFSGCSQLMSVLFSTGGTVVSIGTNAFANCSGLRSLTLPAGLKTIGNSAFLNCNGLLSLTLPAGLTTIGNNAFSYCNQLAEITNLNPTPITITPSVFDSVNISECKLKVPATSVDAYKAAAVWKDFFIVADATAITETGNADHQTYSYPNPVQDIVYIESSYRIEKAGLYDMSGKIVKELQKGTAWILVSDLVKGVYILKIETTQGIAVKKIVKQ